jgi:hypothetical protein
MTPKLKPKNYIATAFPSVSFYEQSVIIGELPAGVMSKTSKT